MCALFSTTTPATENVTETTTTTDKPSKKEKVKKEKKSKKSEKNGDLQTDVSLVIENGNDTLKSVKRKESVGAKIKRVFTLGKGDKKKAMEQAASNGTTEIIPTSETNGDVTTEKIEENVDGKVTSTAIVEATVEETPNNGEVKAVVDVVETTTTTTTPPVGEEVTKQQELTLTATSDQTAENAAAILATATEKHKHQCVIV